METVEVVWKSSFRSKITMNFISKEYMCTLDLGSVKVEKD